MLLIQRATARKHTTFQYKLAERGLRRGRFHLPQQHFQNGRYACGLGRLHRGEPGKIEEHAGVQIAALFGLLNDAFGNAWRGTNHQSPRLLQRLSLWNFRIGLGVDGDLVLGHRRMRLARG